MSITPIKFKGLTASLPGGGSDSIRFVSDSGGQCVFRFEFNEVSANENFQEGQTNAPLGGRATNRKNRNMAKDQPVHEVRLGAIKAAIWKNNTENGVRYNTTFSRLYKDGKDWKHTDSFGRDDLLVLAKVSDTAHSWIHEQEQKDREAAEKAKGSK